MAGCGRGEGGAEAGCGRARGPGGGVVGGARGLLTCAPLVHEGRHCGREFNFGEGNVTFYTFKVF